MALKCLTATAAHVCIALQSLKGLPGALTLGPHILGGVEGIMSHLV